MTGGCFSKSIDEDTFTLAGAERLADDISNFWLDRGFKVRLWVERSTMPVASTSRRVQDRRHWVVRSELKNGLPRPVNPIVDLLIQICRDRQPPEQERAIAQAQKLGLIDDDEKAVLWGLYTLNPREEAVWS